MYYFTQGRHLKKIRVCGYTVCSKNILFSAQNEIEEQKLTCGVPSKYYSSQNKIKKSLHLYSFIIIYNWWWKTIWYNAVLCLEMFYVRKDMNLFFQIYWGFQKFNCKYIIFVSGILCLGAYDPHMLPLNMPLLHNQF